MRLHKREMDLDRRQRRRLDEYASEFNRRAETMDVVDALGALLPTSACEAIQCKLNQEGPTSANRELSRRVRSRDGWFEKLIFALDKCGGCDDLIEKLIIDKKGSLMPGYMYVKGGSPGFVVESSSNMPRLTKTSFPNKEEALQEQALQFTKYSSSVQTRPHFSKELSSTQSNQETGTLVNTASHSKYQVTQISQVNSSVTPQSPDMSRSTNTSFPNKQQALREQATQLKKFETPVQTRPETSKELTSTKNDEEKGTLESTASQKGREEVKRQTDDKIWSYQRQEKPRQEERSDKTIELRSSRDCKESVSSLIDEKEKDEAGNIGSDPRDIADDKEPQLIEKSKSRNVVNEPINQNADIDVGQQSEATSSLPTINAQYVGRDVGLRSATEDTTSKGLLGAGQNRQISHPTDRQQTDVHERSTICVSKECNGQTGIDKGRLEMNLCKVDPNKKYDESGDIEEDDDAELRFFRGNVKEQKYFSKAGEKQKEILKHLGLLTEAGERNVTKLKEFVKNGEKCNSGNSYQPLRGNSLSSQEIFPPLSDDTPPPHYSLSGQEVSLQLSAISKVEDHYTYPPNNRMIKNEHTHTASSAVASNVVVNGEEVNSPAQNNAGFPVKNQKGAEAMKDPYPTAGNNDNVVEMRVGHHQSIPVREVNDKVVNGVSQLTAVPAASEEDAGDDSGCQETPLTAAPAASEEDAGDDSGCQDVIDKKITKAGEEKDEGDETESVGEEADAPTQLDELQNMSKLQPGREIKRGSVDNLNNTKDNLDRTQEGKDEEEPTMELNNGIVGKTVSLIGSLAAMVYRSHST